MTTIRITADAGTNGGDGLNGSSMNGKSIPTWPYLMTNCWNSQSKKS